MEFLRAEGKYIYSGDSSILLRGFGLGGWFLPEGYMWKLYTKCDRPRKMEAMIEKLCGKEYAKKFWQQYLDSYITQKDIEFISKEGFNCVRLPLNARHLYEKKKGQLHLIPEMLGRIDQLIEWCRCYGIYVILDMHAAPGGQTGQNIDDSETDRPLLFMDNRYVEELCFLWSKLAERYEKEPVVAGYDLLNEPLPNFFSQYYPMVLPLYRKLMKEIRKVDKNHMIILEGVHWSSDFSIFDTFSKEEAADNIMLQFHKYWNNPDVESMENYKKASDRLNVPLFMGEGGENNCDWYTMAFPMYEQLNISWSFWSYKKMDCTNSPITFDIPTGWDELINWIDGIGTLESDRAIFIFDQFLLCIKNIRVNDKVLHALKREVPVKIPCEAYNTCHISSKRIQGAKIRETEPVSLIFKNGKISEVDYKRDGGEEQPEEETILVQLFAGDSVGYLFLSLQEDIKVKIIADGDGELLIRVNLEETSILVKDNSVDTVLLKCKPNQKQYIWLSCKAGCIKLDHIYIMTCYHQVRM